jgi:N-acetylglucosamine kinase-like BadF-type ATPase
VAIYLGIDGGGSKTAWAIGDEHSLIARGVVGPSNFVRVGEAKAREALFAAIGQACAAAGIQASDVRRTCLGLAGAGQAQIKAWAHRTASESLQSEIQIVGDMVTAHEAAFEGGPGAVVIAGTGSIAFARNAKGETARAGGWGFAISDEGSGHWIGRKAITAVLHAADASVETSLLGKLLECWHSKSVEDLAATGNASPPPDFASLVPAVLASAEASDKTALGILELAATELAEMASVVIRKILGEPSQVAMCGGVFRHSEHVRQAFYHQVRALQPRAQVHSEVVDPVDGALSLARSARLADAASI